MTSRAVGLLVAVCSLLQTPDAAWAERCYTARELYALVQTGIPLLERRDDGDLLHLQEAPLTPKERETQKQLEALGYVDALGTQTEPSIELRIDHSAAKVGRIEVRAERWGDAPCRARVVLLSSAGAKLFAQEWKTAELAKTTKATPLVATPAAVAPDGKSSLRVQLFQCRPVLREIVVR